MITKETQSGIKVVAIDSDPLRNNCLKCLFHNTVECIKVDCQEDERPDKRSVYFTKDISMKSLVETPFKCPYGEKSCRYVDTMTATLDKDCRNCEEYTMKEV